jgi:parvulin-like peptidyl-prolyl isomerase
MKGVGRRLKPAQFRLQICQISRPDGDVEQKCGHAAMLPFEKKMMKTLMLLALLGLTPSVRAQSAPPADDPVVVAINGRDYRKSEIETLVRSLGGPIQANFYANRQAFLDQYALTLRLEQLADEQKMAEREPFKSRIAYSRMMTLATAMLSESQRGEAISPEEEKKYYAAHKAEYSQAQTRMIFLPFAAAGSQGKPEAEVRKSADALVKRARAGESFIDLVKQYSEDSDSKSRDGEFPLIKPGDESLPPQVKAAVFGLKEGEVTDPLRQPNGFYIFKLEKFVEPEYMQIRAEVYNAIQKERFEAWMAEIRKNVKVDIKDSKFMTESLPGQR